MPLQVTFEQAVWLKSQKKHKKQIHKPQSELKAAKRLLLAKKEYLRSLLPAINTLLDNLK